MRNRRFLGFIISLSLLVTGCSFLRKPVVESLVLSNQSLVLDLNGDASKKLSATVNGKYEPSQEVTWAISNTRIASISSDGTVTGLKTGSTKVIATSVQDINFSAECSIKVIDSTPVVSGFSLNFSSITLDLFYTKTKQLVPNVRGTNNPSQEATFVSNDDSIVSTTTDGMLTAHKVGSATITATCKENPTFKATCVVSVTDQTPTLRTYRVTTKSFNLPVTDTAKIEIKVTGDKNPPTTSTYLSNNTKVCTVSEDGVITAVGVGETTIRATSIISDAFFDIITVKCYNRNNNEKQVLEYSFADYNEYDAYSGNSIPNSGTSNLLIIPVKFSDTNKYITSNEKLQNVREDIYKSFFGDEDDIGMISVSEFYEKESFGKVKLQGVVSDWYDASNLSVDSISYNKVDSLVTSAANWFFTQNKDYDRKHFDVDGNGYIDSIILIYGVPDYYTLGTKNQALWAYSSNIYSYGNVESPVASKYFFASYSFMYTKKIIKERTGTEYPYFEGCNYNTNLFTSTFIHELGHNFGLPDYYDYSNQKNRSAGGLTMQDENIYGHDPFSVMALDWNVNPYIPYSSCTLKIKPFQSSHDVIVLSQNNRDFVSPFDEYILIEYYTPTGVNESFVKITGNNEGHKLRCLTASGIRVWHVNAKLTYYNGFSFGSLGTVPKEYVTFAFTNTFADSSSIGRYSPLGVNYANYDILHLVRNYASDYKINDLMSERSFFKEGDYFDITDEYFSYQFVNNGLFDNKESFPWTFTIDSLTSEEATITMTKLS